MPIRTAEDVSVYKRVFHNYNLSKLGQLQANLNMCNFIGMNVIGSCILYKHAQKSKPALTFNVTDIEGSVMLCYVDTLVPGLILASVKLQKDPQQCTAHYPTCL